MIECVLNLSEGRRTGLLDRLATSAADSLLDLHRDPDHNRSVFTLLGEAAVRRVTRVAIAEIDLGTHRGAHPRIGAVDVVPFVPLDDQTLDDAVAARDAYAEWAAETYALPCFLYGPERTLPEVRRRAFTDLAPDLGPPEPHPTAGAVAVGARPVLVAYNLWLAEPDLAAAQALALEVRGPEVRALGLSVGDQVQVSMNLLEPEVVGPAEVYDLVARTADISRAELVGLAPASVLERTDQKRWASLDLAPERTIEARVSALATTD